MGVTTIISTVKHFGKTTVLKTEIAFTDSKCDPLARAIHDHKVYLDAFEYKIAEEEKLNEV